MLFTFHIRYFCVLYYEIENFVCKNYQMKSKEICIQENFTDFLRKKEKIFSCNASEIFEVKVYK